MWDLSQPRSLSSATSIFPLSRVLGYQRHRRWRSAGIFQPACRLVHAPETRTPFIVLYLVRSLPLMGSSFGTRQTGRE